MRLPLKMCVWQRQIHKLLPPLPALCCPAWLLCKNNIFLQPIFQHLSQTRCTSQAGPPVNTAEFTRLHYLTWISIVLCCCACTHLRLYILINSTQLSFAKCTTHHGVAFASQESTASSQLGAQSAFVQARAESLFGLFTVQLQRIQNKKSKMQSLLFCRLLECSNTLTKTRLE